MTEMTDAFMAAFPDFNIPGVPASGLARPVKARIRNIATLIDRTVSGAVLGIVRYANEDLRDADTTQDDGVLAYVYLNNDDAADPANGFSQWDAGTEAWIPAPWAMAAVAAAADPLIAAALMESLGGGRLGDIRTAPVDGSSDASWAGRTELSEQAFQATDLTDSSQYQLLLKNGQASPGSLVAESEAGGLRRLTFDIASPTATALITPRNLAYGYPVAIEGVVETAVGDIVQAAFGIAFQATAPTAGGPTANMDADGVMFLYRANTGMVLAESDGFTPADGYAISDTTGDRAFTVGQVVRVVGELDNPAGTSATFHVFADDVPIGHATVTGDFSDKFYGPAARSPGGVGDVADVRPLTDFAPSLDVPLRIVLDPSADEGGDGSAAAPFKTDREVMRALSYDTMRRNVVILIKGSAEDFGLDIDARGGHVSLIGEAGVEVELAGSQTIPIGAPWELVEGTTDVYAIDNPGRPQNMRGIVQRGRSQTYGLNGETTIEGRFRPTVRPVNVEPLDLLVDQTTSHISGDLDGKTLVRLPGGGDPADYEWGIPTKAAVIRVRGPGTLTYQGLRMVEGFNFGLQAETLTIVNSGNCEAHAIIGGFGFDHKDCTGSYDNCWTIGSSVDGHHFLDSTFTDTGRILPAMTVTNSGAIGLDADEVSGFFGDAGSPHLNNEVNFHNFTGISCGKSAVAMTHAATITGVLVGIDCFDAALTVGFYPGIDVKTRVSRIVSLRNRSAVLLNAGTLEGLTGEVEVDSFWSEDSARTHAETFATGEGTELRLILRNAYYNNDGVTPSEGNTKDGAAGIGSADAETVLPSIIVKQGTAL